jgi:hypothetical protein
MGAWGDGSMGAWVVLVACLTGQDPSATLEQRAVAGLQGEHPFAERAALAEEIGAALSDGSDREARGRLTLLYVRTMRAALGAIPMDARAREPYQAFLQRHQGESAYSEPAGQWMLTPDAIWTLHEANRASRSAEAIAWEAVDNGMPGECEGYPPCELATIDALDGEYLRRHPDGAHGVEVLKRIGDTCAELERLLSAPNGHELFDPVSDCGNLAPKAKALDTALRAAKADASGALSALAQLRGRCR